LFFKDRNAPNNVRDDDNNSLFADEKKVPGPNQQISVFKQ
jgi:hypothetical protein